MENTEKRLLQWGKYKSDENNNLSVVEPIKSKDKTEIIGEESTIFANHTPILVKRIITDDGVERIESLTYEIWRNGKKQGETTVTVNDIRSQTPNIKFGADCRILPVRGAKSLYSDFMQLQCEDAPCETVYKHTGYAVIDGERVFLNGGYSVTKEGLTSKFQVVMDGKLGRYGFTSEKHPERYETLLNELPKVAPKTLIYTGLAYVFLTPLNALLREIGYEPRFILYFVGKTGSRKTTMANLFLSFFGDFHETESAPISFKDTPNAADMAMGLLDSTLTLLDDRIPSFNRGVKDKMESMEQNALRAIGDRAGRARLNPNGTLKPIYRPVANLITTAEEAYSNVGESAISRSIACELRPDDVHLEALTVVQK